MLLESAAPLSPADRKGDEERAKAVSTLVVAACDRALKRGTADEWLRPTLLGAAFDAADCDKAEELAEKVIEEGPARWKLDATIADLEASVLARLRTPPAATG